MNREGCHLFTLWESLKVVKMRSLDFQQDPGWNRRDSFNPCSHNKICSKCIRSYLVGAKATFSIPSFLYSTSSPRRECNIRYTYTLYLSVGIIVENASKQEFLFLQLTWHETTKRWAKESAFLSFQVSKTTRWSAENRIH